MTLQSEPLFQPPLGRQAPWLLLLCTLLLTACNASTPHPLRLVHNNWPGYEPLVLAQHLGIYRGVEVVNFRVASATDALLAFEHQHADVVALTLDEALTLQGRYPEPLLIIAVLDISNGADAIIARGDIRSIDDLRGRRVGVETSAVGAYLLTRALEGAPGLELGEIEVIPLKYHQHQEAFTTGQVDAVVTFEPVKTELLKRGGSVIFDSRSLKNEIVDVLLTRASYAQSRPDTLRALLTGYFATLERVAQDPQRYLPVMAGLEGVSADIFTRSLSGIEVPALQANHHLLSGERPELAQTMALVRQFMTRQRVIPGEGSAMLQFSSAFLPAVRHD